jgi:hypothetical protein
MISKNRTFLIVSISLATLAQAAPFSVAAQDADRIWSGGPVITMNDAAMRAEAVAEKDGRILGVGTEEEVMKLRGRNTQVIDLAGRTILPGFVDAHGHMFLGGMQALSANMLPPPDGEVSDIAKLQQTLRDWAEENPETVDSIDLIVGFGYDNAQLQEQRHPTRDDLDEVSTDVPIVVIHQSAHLASLNSKALELVGFDASTEDPQGGVIQRREGSREPNGVLEETAWGAAVPSLFGKIDAKGGKAMIAAGAELWARFGYTTAQEGRAAPSQAELIRAVGKAGDLAIDVAVYPDVLLDREYIKKNVSPDYKNRVRIAGAKLTIDGSPQGFTAKRDRPYYDPVGNYPPGYSGYAAATDEQVIDAIDWAFANDIQILTHANGEGAGDLLIAAIDAATEKYGPADRRPVLIHGQFEREDQVDSYSRLGVFPSIFPMHTFYWGDWHRDHTVGPELGDDISPAGWYRQRGMMFTSHHDAPVAFPDSMRVLDATVTRRTRSGDILGPAQRVSVVDGLKALTIWAAYQHFEEDQKGSIEVGKLADLVILSDDPTAVDPEALDTIRVTETIKEGQTVFELE